MNKRMNWGACAALILSLILTVGSSASGWSTVVMEPFSITTFWVME